MDVLNAAGAGNAQRGGDRDRHLESRDFRLCHRVRIARAAAVAAYSFAPSVRTDSLAGICTGVMRGISVPPEGSAVNPNEQRGRVTLERGSAPGLCGDAEERIQGVVARLRRRAPIIRA